MKVAEMLAHIDYRIGPLRDVMAGIEAGLNRIHARMDEEEWFDVDQALEHAVWLLGVAFVAAQAYIEGTIGDVWRIRHRNDHVRPGASKKLSKKLKKECRSRDTALAPGVTRIQFIDAVANHYKHHEGVGGSWRDTMNTLGKAGITASTEYPCARATELLCGNKWPLRALTEILSEWRARVIAELGPAGN